MWSSRGSASSPAPGEGLEAHLTALASGSAPNTDRDTFAPFPVHPVGSLEWDRQIPKKSDQRQMEAWQKLGCYAAGLALDAAGAKDDAALKSRMQLIVAAGGGERDYAVDGQILTGLREGGQPGRLPQRAPDGRPAPDPLSGAALEPARRQHLHRPRRDGRLPHLHGRGIERRRCDPHRPASASPPARTTSSSSAAPTTPSVPTCS